VEKLLASILKSRETQLNIAQELSVERAGFRDYAEKLSALVVEAKDNITNMITDKLHEIDTNLRR